MSLLRALRNIPLHASTTRLIEQRVLLNPHANQDEKLQLYELIKNFNVARKTTQKNKAIEQLIYTTYFKWKNTVPNYLKVFETRYTDLHNDWPIDKDSEHVNDKKVPLLRDLWLRNDHKAIQYTLEHMLRQNPNCPTDMFEPIFEQFHFIMSKPQLQRRKLGKTARVPILLLPMNVLGSDIPDCRAENLLKNQINEIKSILTVDNPILSPDVAQELLNLSNNHDHTMNRQINRRYRMVLRYGYSWINSPDDLGGSFSNKPKLASLCEPEFSLQAESPKFASIT
ncbi:similar to Saccharomyces cerevisiae YLR091W GEP5 Protein of unknown function, required for mitochondrial genome maintenance [Maudiozyma saulgeensis]|uniref:Genetic interactor of prohibitin 5, mitochondrial n=1 Tax=Maudiozyma saulgeensis TaxID=1789683 RepID=A0A1X7R7K3_9SACH|nr:similar to Saccharomyces cerevisiae YLR091W GEP5 Protein of unknown function, required for mitochondrial genome maintenance [Kazachstania saulgeensis]